MCCIKTVIDSCISCGSDFFLFFILYVSVWCIPVYFCVPLTLTVYNWSSSHSRVLKNYNKEEEEEEEEDDDDDDVVVVVVVVFLVTLGIELSPSGTVIGNSQLFLHFTSFWVSESPIVCQCSLSVSCHVLFDLSLLLFLPRESSHCPVSCRTDWS